MNDVLMISSTGGGGSTFIIRELRKRGWNVCQRPDAGLQKVNQTLWSTWKVRTNQFFNAPLNVDGMDSKQLFLYTYDNFKKLQIPNKVLFCLNWGAMGFFKGVEEKPIYLLRNPLFAFNSYSGGTNWNKGFQNRIELMKASGPNDKKWIDAFFGDFSHWIGNAKNGLQAAKEGKGYIVRYHRFKEDWQRIEGLPGIYKKFRCFDNERKVKAYLSETTIKYVRDKTDEIWNQIESI